MRPATCKYYRGFLIAVRRDLNNNCVVFADGLSNYSKWIIPAQFCPPSKLLNVIKK